MPNPDGNLFWGLQLWVNLPARAKVDQTPLSERRSGYRIPEVSVGGAPVRLVAGRARQRTRAGRWHERPADAARCAATRGRQSSSTSCRGITPCLRTCWKVRRSSVRRAVRARSGQIAVFGPGQSRSDAQRCGCASVARCRAEARRAGRTSRPVRHEHASRTGTGLRRLSKRPSRQRLTKKDSDPEEGKLGRWGKGTAVQRRGRLRTAG